MSDTLEAPQAPTPPQIDLNKDIPKKFHALFRKSRYKCAYGGRGAAKSWTFGRILIARALLKRELILCCREYQNSIADSVHRLLTVQIELMGLSRYFDITDKSITCKTTGSEFIFKGLHHNIHGIRSLEGVTIVWVEEAVNVTEESWLILDPTIRREGAEIWISFNTEHEDDPTYQKFVVHPPPNCITIKVGWQDNPWFPENQHEIRLHMKNTDPDKYDWVWEGLPRKLSEAAIFRGNYIIQPFETPERVDRFYFGADWGFANDPTVLIRCFIKDECLYVDHEAYGYGVELDDIPALFAGGTAPKSGARWPGIPGARDWPITADGARPETISYVARQGFGIRPAEKWKGSVEDGIAHLKGFKKIYVHERCTNFAQEVRLYSYKVDKRFDPPQILPIVEDRHNHGVDACIAPGEMITTARGQVPIEEVGLTDKVLTRSGYKSVLWAGESARNKEITTVIFASGHTLRATGDHRILTQRGWVSIDSLRYTDHGVIHLENAPCLKELLRQRNRLFTTVSLIVGTLAQNTNRINGTLNQQGALLYMSKSGWTPTARSLKGIISTTKMITRLITTSIILSAYRLKRIQSIIVAKELKSKELGSESNGPRFARSQKLGTLLRKVVNGTVNTLSIVLSKITPQQRPAFNVANNLRIDRHKTVGSTVARNARSSILGRNAHAWCVETSSSITPLSRERRVHLLVDSPVEESQEDSANASNAGKNLKSFCTGQPNIAQSRVLALIRGKREEIVYDLTVEDEPEYFASGILVHNCRYALDGIIHNRGGIGVWAKLVTPGLRL